MHPYYTSIDLDKDAFYIFFSHEIQKFQFFFPKYTEFILSFKNNN